MSQEIPYLEDIRRKSQEDAIRSIYADWLEDEEDPRGEYLRIRLALNTRGQLPHRYAELEARRRELLSSIEKLWLDVLDKPFYFKLWLALMGESVSGIVTRVFDYGVYVDLGGFEGLVHVVDMSWTRLGHPGTRWPMGSAVEACLLGFHDDLGAIALGILERVPNPWSHV